MYSGNWKLKLKFLDINIAIYISIIFFNSDDRVILTELLLIPRMPNAFAKLI